MKKFRPYDKFPDDIVGKVVRSKEQNNLLLITAMNDSLNSVYLGHPTRMCDARLLFREYEFLDGTPCGEEYEEVVELEHDKVYLVRGKETAWQPRHFAKRDGNSYFFYNEGQSSKTVPSEEISVSRWHQVREYEKKYVRSYTTFDESEYLIKQS